MNASQVIKDQIRSALTRASKAETQAKRYGKLAEEWAAKAATERQLAKDLADMNARWDEADHSPEAFAEAVTR